MLTGGSEVRTPTRVERCCEFVDSRLRRRTPDRARAVTYGQAGENALGASQGGRRCQFSRTRGRGCVLATTATRPSVRRRREGLEFGSTPCRDRPVDQPDQHMREREAEKTADLESLADALAAFRQLNRDLDQWERVHLALGLAAVLSGCYGIGAVEAGC